MTIRVRREHDFIDIPEQEASVFLTPRDVEVLRSLWLYNGVLADYQIYQLLFANTSTMQVTKRRLGQLWRGGYIRRMNKAGTIVYGCNVYWLTAKGASIVPTPPEYPFAKAPLWSQLTHDLVAADVALTIAMAASANASIQIRDWLPEIAFRSDPDTIIYTTTQGERKKRRVEPDLYYQLERSKADGSKPFQSRLLIEVDMVQHRMKRIANEKFLAGTAYLRSDEYERRFGGKTGRWLFITPSMERLEHVKAEAEKVLGRDAEVWHFAKLDELNPATLLTEPVWHKGHAAEPVALFPA